MAPLPLRCGHHIWKLPNGERAIPALTLDLPILGEEAQFALPAGRSICLCTFVIAAAVRPLNGWRRRREERTILLSAHFVTFLFFRQFVAELPPFTDTRSDQWPAEGGGPVDFNFDRALLDADRLGESHIKNKGPNPNSEGSKAVQTPFSS